MLVALWPLILVALLRKETLNLMKVTSHAFNKRTSDMRCHSHVSGSLASHISVAYAERDSQLNESDTSRL